MQRRSLHRPNRPTLPVAPTPMQAPHRHHIAPVAGVPTGPRPVPDQPALATPPRWAKPVLAVGVALGVGALGFYFSWWLNGYRIYSPWLALALAAAAVFNLFQLGVCLGPIPRRESASCTAGSEPADDRRRVCHRVQRASLADRGDTLGPPSRCEVSIAPGCSTTAGVERLEKLAQRLGAGYLTRAGNEHAKAGNLNAALKRTDGEVVGHLRCRPRARAELSRENARLLPRRGRRLCVQVMLTFRNSHASWIARAASREHVRLLQPSADWLRRSRRRHADRQQRSDPAQSSRRDRRLPAGTRRGPRDLGSSPCGRLALGLRPRASRSGSVPDRREGLVRAANEVGSRRVRSVADDATASGSQADVGPSVSHMACARRTTGSGS